MTVREVALKWWKALEEKHQIELAKRYYDDKDFIMVTTSSQKIEMMYRFVELDEDEI